MSSIKFLIEDSLKKEFREHCEKHGKNMSKVLIILIKKYLQINEDKDKCEH